MATILDKLNGGNLYQSAWMLMHIGDLQIIYRLSEAPGTEIPQNTMLNPSAALECVKKLAARHCEHYLDPYCFLEREIQLRALVSFLSLLQLINPARDQKPGPRLIAGVRDTIRASIGVLQTDLRSNAGSVSDKGDCMFMAHYAINLLSDLPGNQSQTSKLAFGFLNLCFAAGSAYTFNGQAAIEQLKTAVASIEPRPSKWHADFDRAHHLVGSPSCFKMGCWLTD